MWDIIKHHAQEAKSRHILDLFDADPRRAQDFSICTGNLLFDYSKTNIDRATRTALISLASDLEARRTAMFCGAAINETEGRAVLHTALRNLDGGPIHVQGNDVMPGVRQTLARMRDFSDRIRQGSITDVINIGIGGSDLGPAMAVRALSPCHDGPNVHFVSNVDGADIADTLKDLDATTTLIIVASKTFTTIETMTNAATARDWMHAQGGDPRVQFAALSSDLQKTGAFGIDPAQVFGFEDWVGGRYSVWGPIGLSVMIAIGPAAFAEFLHGAHAMDQHFCSAAGHDNMPLMHALVGIWHRQVMGYATRAVLPYDQRLALLPAYLQQLEMESNGKSVAMDGQALDMPSGPVVWGAPGTNGQHAFYQLIHQGTDVIPAEFLIAAQGHEPGLSHHHNLLIANCLAQSQALLYGRDKASARSKIANQYKGDEIDRQAAHRVFAGNRPSITLTYPRLDPFMLGQIIALYEHRVFVEGVILGINSFDQWGVELGKELAQKLQPVVQGDGETAQNLDGSTARLIQFIHKYHN